MKIPSSNACQKTSPAKTGPKSPKLQKSAPESPCTISQLILQAPRESDLASSEDTSNVAAASSSGGGSGGSAASKDEISSFVDKKVGGRERKIRRKVCSDYGQ